MDTLELGGLARWRLAEHATSCWPELREVLTNAVDATVVRLFRERGPAAFPTGPSSLRDLRAALAAMPIDVDVEPTSGGRCRVRVRDRGVGLTREDCDALRTAGARVRRIAVIEAMPEWMKPSGAQQGDEGLATLPEGTVLRTRSAEDDTSLTLVLHRGPNGVDLRAIDGAPLDGPGTELSVVVSATALVRQTGVSSWVLRRDLASDPVLDDRGDSMVVRAAIAAIAGTSRVPIRLDGSLVPSVLDDRCTLFDPESGVELVWVHDPAPAGTDWMNHTPPSLCRHRGMPAGAWGRVRRPLRFVANLHFGSARAMMDPQTLYWREEMREVIDGRIDAALRRLGPRWLDDPHAAVPEAQRCWVSRALLHLGPLGTPRAEALAIDPQQHWRAAPLDDRGATLGEVADQPYLDWSTPPLGAGGAEIRLPSTGRSIAVRGIVATYDVYLFHPRCRELAANAAPSRIEGVVRWGAGQHGATEEAFRGRLRSLRFHPDPRAVLPAPDTFVGLAVDLERLSERWPDDGRHVVSRVAVYEHAIVLPYVVRDGALDVPEVERWLRWVAEMRLGGPVDPASLAELALRFLTSFDDDVRADPELKVVYALDELRRQLAEAFGPPTLPPA